MPKKNAGSGDYGEVDGEVSGIDNRIKKREYCYR